MSQDKFCTYLVSKGDFFYRVGRKIASNAYCKAWQTVNLLDENDFGVVILLNDRPAANINLQLKKETNLLKSEKFFQPHHWLSSFQVEEGIAELSALAIDTKVAFKQRLSIFKALILGVTRYTAVERSSTPRRLPKKFGSTGGRCLRVTRIPRVNSLCCAHSIQLLATVQHQATIKLFSQGLGLKLIKNQEAEISPANLPNDNYWTANIPPALYYLLPTHIENQAKCAHFFSELQLAQAQTTFVNHLKPAILADGSSVKL
jgi:hypothetical protein